MNKKVVKNLTITGILATVFGFIAIVVSAAKAPALYGTPDMIDSVDKAKKISLLGLKTILPYLLIPFTFMTGIVAFSKKMDKETKKKILIGILIELLIAIVGLIILSNI